MEFTQNIQVGKTIKEVPFKFKNKAEETEYVSICETIWGCVPLDVNWAKGTNIYNDKKNEK